MGTPPGIRVRSEGTLNHQASNMTEEYARATAAKSWLSTPTRVMRPPPFDSRLGSVPISLEDGFELRVDLLERFYQARFEMLRQGAAVAADDDLRRVAMCESVLVWSGTAKRIVDVDEMYQVR